MAPFLALNLAIMSTLFFLREDSNRVLKSLSVITLFIVTLFMLGLRGEFVGVDTTNYYSLAERAFRGDDLISYGIEPLFVFLSSVSQYFNLGAPGVIFFIALLTVIPLYFFLFKLSRFLGLSLFVYVSLGFYSMSFNISTQMASVVLLSLSLYFCSVRKYPAFLILAVASVLIHYSALVALIFSLSIFIGRYFLMRYFFFLWIGSLPFLVLPDVTLEFLSIFKGHFILYSNYIEDFEPQPLSFRLLLLNLVTCFIFIYMKRLRKLLNDFEWSAFLFFVFSVVLSNIFYQFEVVSRFSLYFQIYVVIIVPLLLKLCFKKNSRPLVYLGVIAFGNIFYIKSIASNAGGIIPYQLFQGF